jgi:NADH dehydrogenase FAD-containing subunit
VPGALEHAHSLDAAGASRLTAALRALAPGARVVVAGGGLTAIEAASELAERLPGLRVLLVSAGGIGQQLSSRAQSHCRSVLSRLGVEVVEGTAIDAVEPGRVWTSAGPIGAELCVWATGFRAHRLLEEAGFQVSSRGQVWVDRQLRARGPAGERAWVIGDAAAPYEDVGAPLQMTCKTALPMGAHVADNLALELRGELARPFSFGDTGYCVSLGRGDGVIQLARRDGSLKDHVITGRAAAFFKELVCRYPVRTLWLEAYLGLGFRWLRGPVRPSAGSTAGVAPTPRTRPERAG